MIFYCKITFHDVGAQKWELILCLPTKASSTTLIVLPTPIYFQWFLDVYFFFLVPTIFVKCSYLHEARECFKIGKIMQKYQIVCYTPKEMYFFLMFSAMCNVPASITVLVSCFSNFSPTFAVFFGSPFTCYGSGTSRNHGYSYVQNGL